MLAAFQLPFPFQMAKTYQQLVQEIETLRVQAEKLKAGETRQVIERIKSAIKVYGLTAEQLGFKTGRAHVAAAEVAPVKPRRRRTAAPGKVAPKYRDEAGNTWTGRGLKPRWLSAAIAEGHKLEEFAI